ncbi:TetR family transcriptional regulator [Bacterioplanes sanyensis]|uniref:TetR family transcriptional regulator n=1 Tax=Bacterioplanes sanyensis TaxID=1249553 RepID=A0A222FN69_9GAMM|nr:TetR/AcrR family transcriptional regulator [Bacterioplanes sanyensis]ASP40230.1 TetR family transcriptional regulator [Bacterioplanes sanyensis]
MSSTPYHHGNLRQALLDAALQLIREHGIEQLSLRAIAREVGVSQTAPYRHFADKNQLLVEIARQTFEELASHCQQAVQPGASTPDNIHHCGLAYLEFALANPERYKLTFGQSIEHRDEYPELVAAGMASFSVLLKLMENGIADGSLIDQDARLLANTCWSSIHGCASLAIDGFYQRQCLLVSNDQLINNMVTLATRAVCKNPQHP